MDDPIVDLINASRRRPAVIHRSDTVLESEVIERDTQHIETEKGKYVVETKVVQATTRYVVVREFDPDNSYADKLEEFISPPESDKE